MNMLPYVLGLLPLLAVVSLASPPDWVPARWNWTEPKTLDLLAGTPVNCLLINWQTENAAGVASFASQAAARGITVLAVLRPGTDPVPPARAAVKSKLLGIVLEGDFPAGTPARVRDALADSHAIVIELAPRSKMPLGGDAPIVGTYQGIWPGIQVTDNGAAKAAPSGAAWIDTNSGFLRAVRAWGPATVWIANVPPAKTVVMGERYLQAIADAGITGARWVIALDDDFTKRLRANDTGALREWKKIAELLRFFEDHREWRDMLPGGKLALVQDVDNGALLSGGILDMIATKHTPVRPVPPQRLSPDALKGTTMAVDVDPATLTPEQRQVLTAYNRGGGTTLSGPPGWREAYSGANRDRITLDEKELKRIDDIWHDMQGMIGRQNLGARLFNVSSMLSNLLSSADGKQLVVELVNYSDYPVENVTVHVLGDFKRARVYTPEGKERELEVYKTEEGTGVDVDKVGVAAAVKLE